jgi:PAS domain S-box-containing protein
MAPASTLNFVLVSLALIVIDFRGRLLRNPTQYFMVLSLSLVMLSLIGYLYGVIYLFEIGSDRFYPIALNAVINFLFLDVAILFMRPKEGFVRLALDDGPAGFTMRNLIPITFILAVLIGWVRFYLQEKAIFSNELIITLTVVINFVLTMVVIWLNSILLFRIDEQREAAAVKLKYEFDLLQSVITSIGEAVVVIDDKHKVLVVNSAATKLFATKMNRMIGRDMRKGVDLFKNGRILSLEGEFGPTLRQGGTVVMDLRDNFYLKNVAGRMIPVSGVISRLEGAGNIKGYVLSFRDISKDKEIDIAKTEFVSLASHQLRTPLSTIGWYAEMLNNGDAGAMNDKQSEYLSEITQANKRMVGMVNALLNVSQIELGVFSVIPRPVNVIKIARIVIKELEGSIEEKKLTIKETYDEKMPVIMADSHFVKIILQNLISNAVNYSSDAGIIRVSISKLDKEMLIKIADEGRGIPGVAQPKVFTKLFRADNIKSVNTAGNGLGLYLVKLIVDKSNGKIWFESKENEGTTFYVRLPYKFRQNSDEQKNHE